MQVQGTGGGGRGRRRVIRAAVCSCLAFIWWFCSFWFMEASTYILTSYSQGGVSLHFGPRFSRSHWRASAPDYASSVPSQTWPRQAAKSGRPGATGSRRSSATHLVQAKPLKPVSSSVTGDDNLVHSVVRGLTEITGGPMCLLCHIRSTPRNHFSIFPGKSIISIFILMRTRRTVLAVVQRWSYSWCIQMKPRVLTKWPASCFCGLLARLS